MPVPVFQPSAPTDWKWFQANPRLCGRKSATFHVSCGDYWSRIQTHWQSNGPTDQWKYVTLWPAMGDQHGSNLQVWPTHSERDYCMCVWHVADSTIFLVADAQSNGSKERRKRVWTSTSLPANGMVCEHIYSLYRHSDITLCLQLIVIRVECSVQHVTSTRLSRVYVQLWTQHSTLDITNLTGYAEFCCIHTCVCAQRLLARRAIYL